VGASGGFDLVFMPDAKNACLLGDNGKPLNAGVYCTNSGSDFPARGTDENARLAAPATATSPAGFPGRINAGTALGTVSANLHLDYAVASNMLVGARLGWLFNGYPGKAAQEDGAALGLPVHAEGRFTYFLPTNEKPLEEGLGLYVFGGVGMTQQASSVSTKVRLAAVPTAGAIEGTVNGWFLGGPFMVGLGAGARYAVARNIAVFAAPRLQFTFGSGASGTAISPEIGMQYGF
jgi:hypothetical protein